MTENATFACKDFVKMRVWLSAGLCIKGGARKSVW